MSTKVERSQIEWRRSKVAELDSQGHSQPAKLLRFISQKSKDSLKSSCDNDGVDKEEKEPDYERDEDQLEEEQEEDAGEITNQVF